MHDKHHGGPPIGLLLILPVVAIAASKAMRHHRMMWDEVGAPESAARRELRLPPRLEWMLETWHTRAHQADAQGDTLTA